MKTTVELPDELMTEVKVLAARERRRLGEMMTDLLRTGLESRATHQAKKKVKNKKQPTVYDLMKDSIGIVDSGITDLATNPKHMEGFGRDSMGRR
jgi:metal-responsive CopG/Arc/MetJ family transcriptional regulator